MRSTTTVFGRGWGRIISIGLLICTAALPAGAQANPEEQTQLGEEAYNQGDLVSAISWYRKAAEQGHVGAQVRLARILDYSEENAEAVMWYQRAADQGDPEAQFELAGQYASGDAVERNLDKALELFQQAADRDYVPAIRVLAMAYESGGLELEGDPGRTIEWLERGVELKDDWSINRLAEAYRKGQLGLERDPARAASVERLGTQPSRVELHLNYDGL